MVAMETPCQKIVWDLVPAIRASLAIELVKKGQSQATSAKLLGIAPSAVSQYISGKRGYRIEFQGETKELIEKLAQDLIDNTADNFVGRMCEICVSARGIESKCGTSCGSENSDQKEIEMSDNNVSDNNVSNNSKREQSDEEKSDKEKSDKEKLEDSRAGKKK